MRLACCDAHASCKPHVNNGLVMDTMDTLSKPSEGIAVCLLPPCVSTRSMCQLAVSQLQILSTLLLSCLACFKPVKLVLLCPWSPWQIAGTTTASGKTEAHLYAQATFGNSASTTADAGTHRLRFTFISYRFRFMPWINWTSSQMWGQYLCRISVC